MLLVDPPPRPCGAVVGASCKGACVKPTRLAALPRIVPRQPSRRDVVRGLIGLGMAALPRIAAGHRKHKHRNGSKKARPNEFGCLSVGAPCRGADQCCSGVCDGKKGQRRCRAHDTGVCDQQADGICTAVNPRLTACDPSGMCACFTTTAGSNFRANNFVPAERACVDCRKDADCEALGFPAGSACIPFTEGNYVGICPTHTVCLPPCGVELPTT
jgi:hypothetical protein